MLIFLTILFILFVVLQMIATITCVERESVGNFLTLNFATLILLILASYEYRIQKEYSIKEYKFEHFRTEISNGDTTVYYKLNKVE